MKKNERFNLLVKLRKESIYQKALNELIANSKGFENGDNFYYMQELVDKYLLLEYETNKSRELKNEKNKIVKTQ